MRYFMANDDEKNDHKSVDKEDSWQEEDDLIDDELDEEDDDEELESYDEIFDETAGTLRAFIGTLVDAEEKEDLLDLITELTLRHGEAIDILNEHNLRDKLDNPEHTDD